jgi:malate synthase
MSTHARVELDGAIEAGFDAVLTPEALEFLAELEREFGPRRRQLLEARIERRQRLRTGESLDFLPETREIRGTEWQVAPVPPDMQQRWVEITGPTDRKMVINALNSGADGFMADFEDANSPTWHNMVSGHINLRDAIDGTITYEGSDGRHYELGDRLATLLVRPRGWHLPEEHLLIDSQPITAALFDFGLFFFHCGRRLIANGSGPYLYLPKMESHLEARLWNDIFCHVEDAAELARGTIKATVLIETTSSPRSSASPIAPRWSFPIGPT